MDSASSTNQMMSTQGTPNRWISTYKEEKGDTNYLLDKELLLLIFNMLSSREQFNCRLVCRRWICLLPVTDLFSGPSATIPSVVSEFFRHEVKYHSPALNWELDMTLERANLDLASANSCMTSMAEFFAKTARNQTLRGCMLNGFSFDFVMPAFTARSPEEYLAKHNEIIKFAQFLGESAAIARFAKENLTAFCDIAKSSLSNPQQVDYISALLRGSFLKMISSIGFNGDYSRFHLDFVIEARSTIFPNNSLKLTDICLGLITHKNTLLNVNMCTYGETEWSEQAIERILKLLMNLTELQILNLEGFNIKSKHMDLLKDVLTANANMRELHLTKSKLDVSTDDLRCLTDHPVKFVLHTSDPKPPLDLAFSID